MKQVYVVMLAFCMLAIATLAQAQRRGKIPVLPPQSGFSVCGYDAKNATTTSQACALARLGYGLPKGVTPRTADQYDILTALAAAGIPDLDSLTAAYRASFGCANTAAIPCDTLEKVIGVLQRDGLKKQEELERLEQENADLQQMLMVCDSMLRSRNFGPPAQDSSDNRTQIDPNTGTVFLDTLSALALEADLGVSQMQSPSGRWGHGVLGGVTLLWGLPDGESTMGFTLEQRPELYNLIDQTISPDQFRQVAPISLRAVYQRDLTLSSQYDPMKIRLEAGIAVSLHTGVRPQGQISISQNVSPTTSVSVKLLAQIGEQSYGQFVAQTTTDYDFGLRGTFGAVYTAYYSANYQAKGHETIGNEVGGHMSVNLTPTLSLYGQATFEPWRKWGTAGSFQGQTGIKLNLDRPQRTVERTRF